MHSKIFTTKFKIIEILNTNKKNDWLFNLADKIKRKYVGNEVHLRGLIEFSNICKCNCKYCGLRSENKTIDRYRISEEEIIFYAKNAVKMGYKTVVLQSGEDKFFDTDKMCNIIKKIKELDIALTLSIGERTFEEYKAFKQAGADRYLIRIETTDKNLYKKKKSPKECSLAILRHVEINCFISSVPRGSYTRNTSLPFNRKYLSSINAGSMVLK